MAEFKVGDIIISKTGTRPARVTYTTYNGDYYVNAAYLHNNKTVKFTKSNIIHYTGDPETMTNPTQLYSFVKEDGTTGYVTYLATNSTGDWVVEEKGSGDSAGTLHTLPKDNFTEVVPYTFSVNINGRTEHFASEEGKVTTGEVLLYTGQNPPVMVVVTGVNTKFKTAKAKFKGARISTTPL
jgi:hypothetical protein